MRAKGLPVSVLIVKVGTNDEKDQNMLIEQASMVLQDCDRNFVNLIEVEHFRSAGELREESLAFEMVRRVPIDVEQFFELEKFDLDITPSLLDSPTHTQYSISSSSVSPNSTGVTTEHTIEQMMIKTLNMELD